MFARGGVVVGARVVVVRVPRVLACRRWHQPHTVLSPLNRATSSQALSWRKPSHSGGGGDGDKDQVPPPHNFRVLWFLGGTWVIGHAMANERGVRFFAQQDTTLPLQVLLVFGWSSVSARLVALEAFRDILRDGCEAAVLSPGGTEAVLGSLLLLTINQELADSRVLSRELARSGQFASLPHQLNALTLDLVQLGAVAPHLLAGLDEVLKFHNSLSEVDEAMRDALSVDTLADLASFGLQAGEFGLCEAAIRGLHIKWRSGHALAILDSGAVDLILHLNASEGTTSALGAESAHAIACMKHSLPDLKLEEVEATFEGDTERAIHALEDAEQIRYFSHPHLQAPSNEYEVLAVTAGGLGLGGVWGALRGFIHARRKNYPRQAVGAFVRHCGAKAGLGAAIITLALFASAKWTTPWIAPNHKRLTYSGAGGTERVPLWKVFALDAAFAGLVAGTSYLCPYAVAPALLNPMFLELQRTPVALD